MLKSLAEATGGAVTVVQRDADLGASFVRELEDFRTSYVLRYTPTGVEGRRMARRRRAAHSWRQIRCPRAQGYFGDGGADSR